MRIIGYIDHEQMKITVFKMDNKISIKFESDLIEQTYKYRTSNALENLEDVKKLVTPTYLKNVETQMIALHRTRTQALNELVKQIEKEEEFDEII